MRSVTLLLLLAFGAPAHAAAIGKLVEAVERSGNFKVRLKATKSLARFDDPRATETLIFALTDPNNLVRAAAANALGKKGERGALKKLCALRRDADDFVRRTTTAALAGFGGVSACDGAQKVYVRVAVSGDAANRGFVEVGLRGKAQADARVLLEPSAEVSHRLELMVRVGEKVDRSAGRVKIECTMSQSIYTLRDDEQRSLQGSATQRGAIELGATASEKAIAGQMRVCMEYLVPVVYDGFSGFLDRLR